SCSKNSAVSRGPRFIFQLPAIVMPRGFIAWTPAASLALRLLFELNLTTRHPEDIDSRKAVAFEVLEHRAATGREMVELIGHAGLLDRRARVAAADDFHAWHFSQRASDVKGAFGVFVFFEPAERAVPEYGLSGPEGFDELGDRLRPDIKALVRVGRNDER